MPADDQKRAPTQDELLEHIGLCSKYINDNPEPSRPQAHVAANEVSTPLKALLRGLPGRPPSSPMNAGEVLHAIDVFESYCENADVAHGNDGRVLDMEQAVKDLRGKLEQLTKAGHYLPAEFKRSQSPPARVEKLDGADKILKQLEDQAAAARSRMTPSDTTTSAMLKPLGFIPETPEERAAFARRAQVMAAEVAAMNLRTEQNKRPDQE